MADGCAEAMVCPWRLVGNVSLLGSHGNSNILGFLIRVRFLNLMSSQNVMERFARNPSQHLGRKACRLGPIYMARLGESEQRGLIL